MPSTYAWGTPPWMSGQHHWGHGSIGVPFSSLPTTGLNGPALGATDTGLAADDEILTRIITVPPLLTYFKCSELGEIEAEGPDGTHTGVRESRANGAVYDTVNFYIVLGSASDLSGSATLDDVGASGGITPPGSVTGTATLDDVSAGGVVQGSTLMPALQQLLAPLSRGGSWYMANESTLKVNALAVPGAAAHRKSLPGTLPAAMNSPLAQSPMNWKAAFSWITMAVARFQSRPGAAASV